MFCLINMIKFKLNKKIKSFAHCGRTGSISGTLRSGMNASWRMFRCEHDGENVIVFTCVLCYRSWCQIGWRLCLSHTGVRWRFGRPSSALRWSSWRSFRLPWAQLMACRTCRPKTRHFTWMINTCENVTIQLTFLPRDCKQMTTEFKFWRSHKSTDWKVSCTGTPKAVAAAKNAEMFSMHLNAILLSFTFLTTPGCNALLNLHRIIPSLRTS